MCLIIGGKVAVIHEMLYLFYSYIDRDSYCFDVLWISPALHCTIFSSHCAFVQVFERFCNSIVRALYVHNTHNVFFHFCRIYDCRMNCKSGMTSMTVMLTFITTTWKTCTISLRPLCNIHVEYLFFFYVSFLMDSWKKRATRQHKFRIGLWFNEE